jgi:hypothetical protein
MSDQIETLKECEIPPWRALFEAACANLPENPEIPYELTPEGQRLTKFRRVCPPEFCVKIDRAKIPSAEKFDAVAKWAGVFPGPCALGSTGAAKTRAAWSALGRLYVRENKPFAWFPVKRLMSEMAWYVEHGQTDAFFRNYDMFSVLMVDDVDKINWQFESNQEALFCFYDWIYRSNKPCITTTNQPREWWERKMGEAFTRRLFDDAHFLVQF